MSFFAKLNLRMGSWLKCVFSGRPALAWFALALVFNALILNSMLELASIWSVADQQLGKQAIPAEGNSVLALCGLKLLASYFAVLFIIMRLERANALNRLHVGLLASIIVIGAGFSMCMYPIASTDLFYYIAHGRKLAILGLNPFTSNLLGQQADPIIGMVSNEWFTEPSYYGPVAVVIFAALNQLSAESMRDILWAFKSCWLLAYLATAAIAWCFLSHKQSKIRSSIMFGFFGNPVIWFQLINDAHIESWMCLFMLGSFLCVLKGRIFSAGALWAAACGIKIVALGALPILALSIRSTQPGQWRMVGRFFGGFAVVLVPLWVVFQGAEWIPLLTFAAKQKYIHYSIGPKLIEGMLNPLIVPFSSIFTNLPFWALNAHASNISMLIALAALFIRTLRHPIQERALERTTWAMFWLFASRPYFQAWYALWFLPLTILLTRSLWTLCMLLVSMSVFFHVATYAPQQTGVQAALHWALLLLVVDYFVVRPKERP